MTGGMPAVVPLPVPVEEHQRIWWEQALPGVTCTIQDVRGADPETMEPIPDMRPRTIILSFVPGRSRAGLLGVTCNYLCFDRDPVAALDFAREVATCGEGLMRGATVTVPLPNIGDVGVTVSWETTIAAPSWAPGEASGMYAAVVIARLVAHAYQH